MKTDHPSSPFPSGWFMIAFSSELRKGKILSKTFMGQEIVLFRTNQGIPSALDAHCPHLGAHLGHGGKIINDCIRCPFHHLQFDTNGQCTNAKHIQAKTWLLEERDGLIFLYHGDPKKMHLLPHLTPEGWKSFGHFSTKNLKSRPEDMMENGIDLGHFTPVHNISITFNSVSEKNNVFTGEYQITKMWSFFGNSPQFTHLCHTLQVFGLGYSLVKGQLPKLGIEVALLTTPTPTDDQHLNLTCHFFIKHSKSSFFLPKFFIHVIMHLFFKQLSREIKNDTVIWQHKQYLTHPRLTSNDKFILTFRKWARRFYE